MLYNRIIKVDIDGLSKTLTYPELKIFFKGEVDNNDEADVFEIKIYNLSKDTISLITSESNISLQAGYENEFGTINVGVIKDVYFYKEKSDYITEIIMTTDSEAFTNATINKTFNPPINSKQILERITPLSGLELGSINLNKNINYQRGKTVSGKIINVIKQLAEECQTPVTISNGKINFTTKQTTDYIIINSQTGLISSVEKVKKKDSEAEFMFDTLMIFKLKPKGLVRINSKDIDGDFEIVKMKYNEDYTINVEVKEV